MRKRLTQQFPFLLPLRKKQRQFFFYTKMELDGNKYAVEKDVNRLPNLCAEITTPMYNRNTGFDFKYQENKVFNLKLAAVPINWLLIKPNETFSFWKLVHHADKYVSYKDGLTVINGETVTAEGGGLCQLSNLLFQLFLHSPLTIVERTGHRIKEFPELSSDSLKGVDATIADGWIDLKVRNDTEKIFQLGIYFDEVNIKGYLYTDQVCLEKYRIRNENLNYESRDGNIVETVEVWQDCLNIDTNKCISSKKLYTNSCLIGYEMNIEEKNL